MEIKIILITILVLVLLIGCGVQEDCPQSKECAVCEECPAREECPTCPTMNCKEEQEPYVEQVPYEYTLKYEVIEDSTVGTLLDLTNWGTKQTTKIKNFDDKGGEFEVIHRYRTLNKEGTKRNSTFVSAGETKDFITTFDTEIGEDVEVKTEIINPKETRYKEVIKYKPMVRCNCS